MNRRAVTTDMSIRTGQIMTRFFILILTAAGLATACGGSGDAAIGVYPGNPEENFAPAMVPGDLQYRNMALERAATQSSAFDLDQAAQLATDGIRGDEAGFRSAWKSAGSRDEWIAVDLGGKATVDKAVFHWLNAPVSGRLLISSDGAQWKEVAAIGPEPEIRFKKAHGRYVKAVLDATADSEPFELEEWEVWGSGGVKAQPKPAPERKDGEQELAGGAWKLARASAVAESGEVLSSPGYDDSAWMPATVPGTVLGSYVATGAVHEPNYADNQVFISDSYFNSDFWYRDRFEAHPDTPRQFLHFDGINFKALIYLNGKEIGGIECAFDAARFDVTGILQDGENNLAVRIIRNPHYGEPKLQDAFSTKHNGGVLGADNPTMHATIGWDWLPTVRGRNIGIYDRVYIRYTGEVTVDDPFVRTELPLPDTTKATVFASATLTNHAEKPVQGVLKAAFGDLVLEQEASLEPGESRLVTLAPATLENPRLWWPNGYGKQELYPVCFSFSEGQTLSDSVQFRAGVRQLDYTMEPYVAPRGDHFSGRNQNQRLSLFVNGRRFIGFGGNWGYPEHLLRYRSREYDIAVGNHAAMNFTMIRNWVGMTDNKAFYEACDRHGILIWQDFWLANPADGPNPEDPQLFNEVATRYVRRIRNHPSIGLYVGRNEGYPPAEIDDYLKDMVREEHPGLYYVPHSGTDGVSGGGPYRALPVEEYFKLRGDDRIHSERGMPAVMNYENLVRAMGAGNVEPVSTVAHPNDMYGIHDWTLGGIKGEWCAQRTESFNQMLEKAFGEPADAREFAYLSQWINYDGYRAMFESRSEHRRGLLLWMSHPSWPSMVWQTYDYYFEPTGAYFGCKKACEPLHIQMNALKGTVEVVNYHAGDRKGLTATARYLDMYGSERNTQRKELDIAEDSTVTCFPLEVPEGITDAYFVRLELSDPEGHILSDNFYWQGRESGDVKALRTLGKTRLGITLRRLSPTQYTARIENKGKVPALMIRLKAVDSATRDLILPVRYSDNYFFLLPGESREIDIKVESSRGRLRLEAEGLNI